VITQEQLIQDIKRLPDAAVQSVGLIVRELIALNITNPTGKKPVYGSGKGKMWIADDFDAPLEELREYTE
jgi:hypothetical protein